MHLLITLSDPAPTEISTLSLHDALPICAGAIASRAQRISQAAPSYKWGGGHGSKPAALGTPVDCSGAVSQALGVKDRKSTRLNSSHITISYAVFCLKKKKQITSRSRTSS